MKAALSLMLAGIVLVGSGDDSRPGARSGDPPATESAQSNMRQAPDDAIPAQAKGPEPIFPDIKPAFRAVNLRWIDAYCRQRGIRRLGRDRVRLFTQPMGVISEAIEIDFASRQLTVYPGTHSKKQISQTQLDEEQIAQIRALVTSDKFKRIPRENKKIGFDGTSYLLEVSIGDAYSWKLHWAPDDEELNKVVAQIRSVVWRRGTDDSARQHTPIKLAKVPFVLRQADGVPLAEKTVMVYDGRVEDGTFPHALAKAKEKSYFLTAARTDSKGKFFLDLSESGLSEIIIRPGEDYRTIHFRRESDLSHTKSVNHIRIGRDIYDLSQRMVTRFRHVGFAKGKPRYEKDKKSFSEVQLIAERTPEQESAQPPGPGDSEIRAEGASSGTPEQ